jgi:hypothetical protein
MLEKQIHDLIERYLAHKVDRSGFAQEFAGLYFQARNDRNVSRNARQLCDSIVLPFAEVSRGHRSESSFREELTRIARPFVPRIVSIDSYSADPYAIAKPRDVDFGQATRKPPMMAMVAQMGQFEDWLIARQHG